MARSELFLLALRPPGNIERILVGVQERLFRDYALVSALALPPLIPLAFVDSAPPEPRAFRQGFALSGAEWITSGATLFLRVQPVGWLRELAGTFEALETNRSPAPFPPEPALYLAAGEPEGTTLSAVATELGSPPELRWVTSRLECARLELAEMPEWWDNVSTETLWSVRLPRAYETG